MNRYDEAKRWTNTYQVVLATDEIRSYVIFNYAHINWTSSNIAGALQGRGGLQSALAGFNAGNGTGKYIFCFLKSRLCEKRFFLTFFQVGLRCLTQEKVEF